MEEAGAPPPADDGLPDDATCPACGYSLRGLAHIGMCPECGHRYDPLTLGRCIPLPDAVTLCLDLGWPMLLLALTLVVMITAGADLAILLLPMSGAMCVLMLAYAPWRAHELVRRHVPPIDRPRNPVVAAWRLGPLPFAVLTLSIAVGLPGLALCGACLTPWVFS